MPRSKNVPAGHTEFGGGPGLIDNVRRSERIVGTEAGPAVDDHVGEELWEIYATNPADPNSTPETSDLNYQPRPTPTPWHDPKTAKGTN
jgi:hypothetical protein